MASFTEEQKTYVANKVEGVRDSAFQNIIRSMGRRGHPDDADIQTFIMADLWVKFNEQAKTQAQNNTLPAPVGGNSVTPPSLGSK